MPVPTRTFLRGAIATIALAVGVASAPAGARAATFATLDAGADHTCAIRPGGAAYCWGTGQYGQLGVIGAVRARTPLAVIGSYTAVQLSSGNGYWCELLAGGKVSCTGTNSSGQLGTGGTASAQYPQDVIGLPSASRVEVGRTTSCAITVQGLYCWGDGARGQLGNGQLKFDPTPSPFKVPEIGKVLDVAVAKDHVCAITEARNILCWGDTKEGKLGNAMTSPITTPGEGVTGIADAVQVVAGDRHSCALRASKTVWCWGNNELGQLGNGNNVESRDPVQVQGLSDVTQLSTQSTTTCAIRGDGSVWCWGNGEVGQLGNGVRGKSNVPVQVQGIAEAMVVSVGENHACAVTKGLAPYCWGSNRYAQLGSGGLIGDAAVEPTAQIVQDAVRGTAKFIPTPLPERGSTSRGGQVYLRLLHLTRRGSKCPTTAAVTIRTRGREVVRTARDVEKADGDCTVTGLLNLPTRTQRAFTVVVVVRGKNLKTRKVTLRARVGQT